MRVRMVRQDNWVQWRNSDGTTGFMSVLPEMSDSLILEFIYEYSMRCVWRSWG